MTVSRNGGFFDLVRRSGHFIPVVRIAKALSEKGVAVTLVGMNGSSKKALDMFGGRELPPNFSVCEVAASRYFQVPFDPKMEFTVENIAPQLYVCRFSAAASRVTNSRSRKSVFVSEAIDLFEYLQNHIFDRSSLSPPLSSSCNGGKMPHAIVADSLSFSGPLVAADISNLSLILNNPSGILEVGADPMWFPVTSVESDPLRISTVELLRNAWDMV